MNQQKNILILGATSAIAKAVTRKFAEKNHRFLLVSRNPNTLDTVAKDIDGRGADSVETLAIDLSSNGDHEKLMQKIETDFANLDLVFLAYGSLPDQQACENSYEALLQNYQTNFLSATHLLHRLTDFMLKNKRGTLAVVTSVAGDKGRMSNYAYGSAKGALSIFLSGLRHRLSSQGIHVLDIKPGFVDSPMTAHVKKGPLFASPEQVAGPIVRAIQKKRGTVYVPWFWFIILNIIKHTPNFIFHKTKL